MSLSWVSYYWSKHIAFWRIWSLVIGIVILISPNLLNFIGVVIGDELDSVDSHKRDWRWYEVFIDSRSCFNLSSELYSLINLLCYWEKYIKQITLTLCMRETNARCYSTTIFFSSSDCVLQRTLNVNMKIWFLLLYGCNSFCLYLYGLFTQGCIPSR